MRDPRWVQAGLDALRASLDVDAATKRAMIAFLLQEGYWDARKLSPAAALTRFNACLNPAKPDFFKLSEVWALMKAFGRHELALAIIEDLGYERPRLIPTASRRLVLLERLAAAEERHAALLVTIQRELQALGSDGRPAPPAGDESGTRGIHPANLETGPRFALDNHDEDSVEAGGF